MKAWWLSLVLRERILIALAGSLTSLVVLFQFVLSPMLNYRTELRAELERVSRDLERVETAYMRKRAMGGAMQPSSGMGISVDQLKAEITQSAREKGLEISRLQDTAGRVGLTIDRGDPRLVFFWLEDIETRFGTKIARLNLEQAGGDRVRVTVEFERKGVE